LPFRAHFCDTSHAKPSFFRFPPDLFVFFGNTFRLEPARAGAGAQVAEARQPLKAAFAGSPLTTEAQQNKPDQNTTPHDTPQHNATEQTRTEQI
jgi:hypothetical protein